MKKTLLFAGLAGMLISGAAFGFADDNVDDPAFTDNNSTYIYATKHTGANGSGDIKLTAATTAYVDARKTEAQALVDTLDGRTEDDEIVVGANKDDLVGIEDWSTNQNATWDDRGLQNNRQVVPTAAAGVDDECDSLNNNYSGCGYIALDGDDVANQTSTDYHDGDSYQWVKIRTNCGVPGQENAANCVTTGTGS